jgi:hypothetical protein
MIATDMYSLEDLCTLERHRSQKRREIARALETRCPSIAYVVRVGGRHRFERSFVNRTSRR